MKQKPEHSSLYHLFKDLMALAAISAFSYAAIVWLSFLSTLAN